MAGIFPRTPMTGLHLMYALLVEIGCPVKRSCAKSRPGMLSLIPRGRSCLWILVIPRSWDYWQNVMKFRHDSVLDGVVAERIASSRLGWGLRWSHVY